MKYIIKTLFLSILINSIYAQSKIIDKNGWGIINPENKKSENIHSVSNYFSYLQKLGFSAFESWKNLNNPIDKLKELDNKFQTVDNKFLINLIDEIITNQNLLEEVTKDSYKNVTGFLKIVLAKGGEKSWKIRLHLWESKEEKEHPHNHKWDFYSKIMLGHLTQDLYQITEDSKNSKQYTTREPVSLMPKLPNGESACACRDDFCLSVKEEKPVNLKLISQDIIQKNQSYFMPNNLIHTITPSQTAVSLIFASPTKRENSEVFVELSNNNDAITRHSPSLTTEGMKIELLKIKNILSNQGEK